MALKAVDKNSVFDFGKAANDIESVQGSKENQRQNSEIELNRNYKALVDNFEATKNLPLIKTKETYVEKILEFSKTTKSQLKLDDLKKWHKREFFFNKEVDIEVSRLMTYIAYFLQSVDYIEDLSADKRVFALEEPGEVLEILRAATKLDGIFFKSFYHVLNKKYDGKFLTERTEEFFDFIYYAIGVFILQMFFVFEQFVFLADSYYKKGNLAKYNKYLNDSFLVFKQMKSQLVGKKSLISKIEAQAHIENISTWKTILNEVTFPGNYERANLTNIEQLFPLHIAAFQSNFSIIQTELEKSLNDNDTEGFTPLHCAVFAGSTVVEAFLAYKTINVNAQSKAGLTALHIATIANAVEVIKILVKSPKMDVNMACMDGWTALHIAVSLGQEEIVAELLKAKELDVNAKIFGHITALHIAAKLGQKNLIKMLLQQGADVECRTRDGLTALQIAKKFDCLNAVKLLESYSEKSLQKPAEALFLDKSDWESPLSPNDATENSSKSEIQKPTQPNTTNLSKPNEIIQQKNSNFMMALLQQQLEIGADDDLTTQLFKAAFKGQLKIIKSLVAKGADVNALHKSGKEILHFVSNLEVFEYFIEEHNLSAPPTDPSIFLFNAVQMGSFDIVKYLIEVKDLNPHLKSIKNETLLCAAIAGGNFEIVKYLIEDQGTHITSAADNCPLCSAIAIKNVDMVEYFLNEGLNVLGVCDGQRPILHAAEKSSLTIFLYLLERGASIDVKNNGKGVFDHAAIGGNLEVLKYLVNEKNHELNSTVAGSKLSIFFQVAKAGTLEAMKYFIEEHKFSIHDKGPLNGTILHEVAFNRNLDVIKYFVEHHGLNAKVRDNKSFPPLFYAVQDDNLVAVNYFLMDRKLGVHLKDKENRTALHIAAINGHLDVVRYLVEEHNANLNGKDNDGFTPVVLSYRNNKFNVVRYLEGQGCELPTDKMARDIFSLAGEGNSEKIKFFIEVKGMKADIKDSNGQTPLFYAADAGKLDAVKYFLAERKMEVDLKDNNSRTALHIAAMSGHMDVVRYLVEEQNANLHGKDNDGNTPLVLSFKNNKFNVMSYLESQGCDLLKEKPNVLHSLAREGNLEKIKFLVETKGMKADIRDNLGRTPLFNAANAAFIDVVKYLVESQNVDINIRCHQQRTALFSAVLSDNLTVVKYLVKKGAKIEISDKYNFKPIICANTDIKNYLISKRDRI